MTVTTLRPRPAPVAPADLVDLADLSTPYLDVDVPEAVTRYLALHRALAGAVLHYSVDANADPFLLRALCRAGASFAVAGLPDVRAVLGVGAAAASLLHGTPVERLDEIDAAYRLGVRLFVVGSADAVRVVSTAAPGSAVLCRVGSRPTGPDRPLPGTVAADAAGAVAILRAAAAAGLQAVGVSLQVSADDGDSSSWTTPVEVAARIFAQVRQHGLNPTTLDIADPFPVPHDSHRTGILVDGQAVIAAVRASFPDQLPRLILRSGGAVVDEACAVVSTVIAVVRRDGTRWVHLDGVPRTTATGTASRCRPETSADGGPTGPAILAGPTCDAEDTTYVTTRVRLPNALAVGDIVRMRGTGPSDSRTSSARFGSDRRDGFAPVGVVLAG